jgi:uncharacterized MAPEG superfamily protein
MATPLLCLLGFAGWAVLLVLAIGVARVSQVLAGQMEANQFPSGERHGGDRYWRLNRAHANALENLPIFGAIVLVGAVTGVSEPILSTLSVVVLVGRLLQSSIHIASNSNLAVNLRFSCYAAQVVSFVWMGLVTARAIA